MSERTAKQYLESEVTRLVSQAREITRKAEDENRGLDGDERMKVEGLIQETNHLKSRIAEMDDNDRLLAAIDGASVNSGGQPTTEDPSTSKSLGEAFVKSQGYEGLMKRGLVGSWTTGPIAFGSKLNDADGNRIVAESGSPVFGGGTSTLQPQVLPGIQGPVEQRPTVADLLGQGQTSTNAIVYLKETLLVPGAFMSSNSSVVLTSEGGLKPAAQLDFNKVTASVDKIATFLPVSDEMLEDQPQVSSYINGRLQLFVRQAEENYIITKLYANAGRGSSATEVDGTNMFDAIAAAMMHVRLESGLEPDALLVSPLDAAKMDVLKSTGGTGQYFSGGPYGSPSQNPWGLRRIVTANIANFSPLVGAFREGATLWRRGGMTLEASNSHSDYFRRNLTALRCEERLAVTVFRDRAFQVAKWT